MRVDIRDRLWSGCPNKTTSQTHCQCSAQSSTDLQSKFGGQYFLWFCTQTTWNRLHKVCQEACRDCPSLLGSFVLITGAIEPWMCTGMLRSATSPDCAYCSWLIVSSVRVWRGCGEPCADWCTDTVKAFGGGSVTVKSSISQWKKQSFSSLEVISVELDIKMSFCNQWQSISPQSGNNLCPPRRLTHTEWSLSEIKSRI